MSVFTHATGQNADQFHRSMELRADLIVVGAGAGGVAAAMTAARLGRTVVLTEPTGMLGGQFTSQAVPPDEHPWIETELVSPSYARLRSMVRDRYRRAYPVTAAARADPLLNPGLGFVSRLCAEPVAWAAAVDEILAPFVAAGAIRVLRKCRPTRVDVEGDQVQAVTVTDAEDCEVTLVGNVFIDATELGDLLPLAGAEHVVGAESAEQTGELHAPPIANLRDQQAFSWCFAVEFRPGEDHTILQPDRYSYWESAVADFWPGPQLSWTDVEPITLATRERRIFEGPRDTPHIDDLWHYRRILAESQFEGDVIHNDVSLVNWPQIDYWEHLLVSDDPLEPELALRGARELSSSFLYWMQTAAPREDGGRGYPELMPRGDLLGSKDHLAVAPYIRESRRIASVFTVTEKHIGREMRGADAGSEIFADSVGIGYYRIDLHPSAAGRTYVDIDCFPFQIPLGALVPVRLTNLVPANKNIGTTHITNGAYRLHPVEWSIGEAAGTLATVMASTGATGQQILTRPDRVEDVQRVLAERLAAPLRWPEDIRTGGTAHDRVTLAGEAR